MAYVMQSRAVLVSINIRRWTAKKVDSKVTAEMCKLYGADSEAGQFILELIPKRTLAKYISIEAETRQIHNKLTSPWVDGYRIITIAGLPKWQAEMKNCLWNLDYEADQIIKELPMVIQLCKIKHAGLFDESNYPTMEQIRSKFGMHYRISPVPNMKDWRLDVSEEEMKHLRENLKSDMDSAIGDTVKDVADRITTILGHMTEKLRNYQPANKKAGQKAESTFRNSTILAVKELAELIPSLNVTEDQRLEELRKDIESLVQYNPDEYRENARVRKQTVEKADDILKKVSDFF